MRSREATMLDRATPHAEERTAVEIDVLGTHLYGELAIPRGAIGVIAFTHGGGGAARARNHLVARHLRNDARCGTLLVDLLACDVHDARASLAEIGADVELLARRMTGIIDWLAADTRTRKKPIGLYGASIGGAAALVAASARPEQVAAVVSRSGRPDLAGAVALARVAAPTLFIVGSLDPVVLDLHTQAQRAMHAPCVVQVVNGASHFFEEPGAMAHVARLASDWFAKHLDRAPQRIEATRH
jgi:pimeloyl-ACP methyl ester carboxylesterase